MIDIDVHKDWGSFTLDVKLHHEGGILGLLGASGCGKSKTLQCIAGIEKPDAGKVVVGARTLFDSGRHINIPVPQRRVDRKSTRLNSSHSQQSRMPSSA